jgi:hypothetical protein
MKLYRERKAARLAAQAKATEPKPSKATTKKAAKKTAKKS